MLDWREALQQFRRATRDVPQQQEYHLRSTVEKWTSPQYHNHYTFRLSFFLLKLQVYWPNKYMNSRSHFNLWKNLFLRMKNSEFLIRDRMFCERRRGKTNFSLTPSYFSASKLPLFNFLLLTHFIPSLPLPSITSSIKVIDTYQDHGGAVIVVWNHRVGLSALTTS